MNKISAFMIAGTHSGCGKTTVSLGIMSYLKSMGLKVQAFKVGPDFIDPGHHKRVTGRASHNLDGWMMTQRYNQEVFSRYSHDADVCVVEGVMGLYDGFSGKDESGSSAQIAKWLNLPVILVVDASSMARSAAAVVLGYRMLDPEVNLMGVIFNKVSGTRHAHFIEEAMSEIRGIDVLGFLPKNDQVNMPSRHLGLVTAEDMHMSDNQISLISEWIREGVDVDRLLKRTSGYSIPRYFCTDEEPDKGVSIGIAMDNAFSFYYEENLRLLKKEGAELIPFSPIRDSELPDNIHGIIFGGGYPELYAEELSENVGLMQDIRRFARKGMPMYAECGGFMYLMDCIKWKKEHGMVGIFPFKCQLRKGLRALGYREIITKKPSLLGDPGTRARGHEFHYSDIIEAEHDGIDCIYQLVDRDGRIINAKEGFMKGNVLGSYIHLHFGSNPWLAASFLNSCKRYRSRKSKFADGDAL